MITMIAAAGENNELGLNNDLVWHLPDDFKRFKDLTSHHHIIMGRKTLQSFPKLLPHRTHIVITRNKDFSQEDVVVTHSMDEALQVVKDDEQPFIIGGGEIYEMGMAVAHRIELTRVHGSFKADTFFPEIPLSEWKLVKEVYHPKDPRHAYSFTYETWDRI